MNLLIIGVGSKEFRVLKLLDWFLLDSRSLRALIHKLILEESLRVRFPTTQHLVKFLIRGKKGMRVEMDIF